MQPISLRVNQKNNWHRLFNEMARERGTHSERLERDLNLAFQQICAPYSVALRTNSQIVPYSRFQIQDTEAGVLVGDKKEKFADEFERGKSVQRLSGYCFQKSFYPDNCYASGRSIDGPQ